MNEADETNVGRGRARLAAALFAAIAVVMAADLAGDARTGAEGAHLSLEALATVLALAGVAALWQSLVAARTRVRQLGRDLAEALGEASKYREEARQALAGLGQAIDGQFERWKLSPAEREVGLLLLKGLSHREAAEVRRTTEATVRQQALALYRKSGLRNRSDLSAFFLEDLLLPVSSGAPPRHL